MFFLQNAYGALPAIRIRRRCLCLCYFYGSIIRIFSRLLSQDFPVFLVVLSILVIIMLLTFKYSPSSISVVEILPAEDMQ